MELPKLQDSDFTERLGVIAVESAVLNARCIWRETLMRDVGIDGQIEYVTPDGRATGRMVLVQVKSGATYFAGATDVDVPFSPSERHRNYWGHCPLPVILCLHEPDSNRTVWVDARREIQQGRDHPIRVPLGQSLDADGVRSALQSDAGPLPANPLGPKAVFAQMRAARSRNAGFDMSFFDIFVHGLTDICRSSYFGMDLVTEIANARLAFKESPFGMGLGAPEYDFIDDYIAFVTAQDLVRFNFDWYKQCHEEMGMVATLLGPLTPRGRELVEYISDKDRSRNVERGNWDQVVVERSVQMLCQPWELVRRVAWIDAFEVELGPPETGAPVES